MKSPVKTSILRGSLLTIAGCLSAMVLFAGCSSTKVTNSQKLVNEKLPRPGTIWIYNFVVNPADVPTDASLAGKTAAPSKPLTPAEIQIGQQLSKSIATQLVEQINAMGLNAEQPTSSSKLKVNDIVIRGYLYSLEAGNAAQRIFIGFGYGASELNALIEGYQMTSNGLRKLGSANLDSIGGEMPGGGATGVASLLIFGNPIALIIGPAIKGAQELGGGPALEGRAKDTATKIADGLKLRFQNQGWISQ
ncbi:MAG: DUF4410 domain-containing protein [Lentisphaerota bacterium]